MPSAARQSGGIELSKFLPSMLDTKELPGQLPKSYQQGFMENGVFKTKTITPDSSGVLKEAGLDTRSFFQKMKDSYELPTTTLADKAGNVIDTALNDGKLPTGLDWIRKVVKGGYESIKASIGGAAQGGSQIIDAMSGTPLEAYQFAPGFSNKIRDEKTGQDITNPNFEKEMQDHADYLKKAMMSPLERGVAMGEGVVKIGSLYFTQVMAELNAAKELPGPLSWPAKAIDWAFMKTGEGGAWVADKGVEALPVSEETKNTIRPLAEELAAFTAQMVGVKLAHGVAQKGLGGAKEKIPVAGEFVENGQRYVITPEGDVMTKADYAKHSGQTGVYKFLPLPENIKGKVSEGTKMAVGLSMNPFSTAFNLANAKIYTKIAERKAKNTEITPEEGKKIIDEVKSEMPAELGLGDLKKNESKGLPFKPHEIADAAVSGAKESMTFTEAEKMVNAKFSPEDAALILRDLPEKVQDHKAVISTEDLRRKIELTGVQREREGGRLKLTSQQEAAAGKTGIDVNKFIKPAGDISGVENKMAQNVKYYQRDGGATIGKETKSPFLRDINKDLATPEGSEAGRRSVKKAIKNGELRTDKNGQIEVYRVGEPSTKNPLASVTYDKSVADSFSMEPANKGSKVYSFKINSDEALYHVGGPEKEILMDSRVVKQAIKSSPEAQKVGKEGTKPLEPTGEGETKTRGLSKGVEAKAVEAKLTKSLGELPEYRTVDMKDQASMAKDLITRNPELARDVAMGIEPPPKGVIPEAVFVAVEDLAIKTGDVETLRDLANSSLTGEATAMGQRIRTLAERDPESPVGAMEEIQKVREKAVEKKVKDVGKKTTEVKNEIKDEIKKTKPSKETWNDFVEKLTC